MNNLLGYLLAKVDYYGPSMKLAYEIWDIAKEEYISDSRLHQKDGCEKAYRATTEAIDVLLISKGETIPVGEAIAHNTRGNLLNKWAKIDPRMQRLDQQYSLYKGKLHGLCFYGISSSKEYQELFESVQGFLDEVAELLKE